MSQNGRAHCHPHCDKEAVAGHQPFSVSALSSEEGPGMGSANRWRDASVERVL